MSDPAAEPVAQMDTGVSQETYNRLKDELANAQKEAAIFKAKMEVHDQRQRSTLRDMQPEVSAFVGDIVADAEFANFKHELEPMTRFCNDMEKSDQVETTVSLGRLISCASAKLKRTRVEASKQAENAELLSSTLKELEELKAENMNKASRIVELEGLCDENKNAAMRFQEELARNGVLKEKIDFSSKSARENVGSSSNAAKTEAPPAEARPSAPRVEDALFAFMTTNPSNAGRLFMPSHANVFGAQDTGDVYSAALAAQ